MNNSFFSKLIKAWLFAGTLDILAATIQVLIKGKNKDVVEVFKMICRYIASAVFGPSARTGGNEMVIAGLAFHYLMHGKFNWLDKIMPILSMAGIAVILAIMVAEKEEKPVEVSVN